MPLSECSSILDAINCALRDRFHITHTTIQFEINGCETTNGCSAPPSAEAAEAHTHPGHSH
jgi:cobalt-zinc-cadmium efflux system protein